MDKFVVGFAFSKNTDAVLLVKKLRPKWQRGLLNGIGGKIEKDENSPDAMNRECKEETGLTLDWTCRGVMQGKHDSWHGYDSGHAFQCYIFYAYSDNIYMAKQIEDESLVILKTSQIESTEIIETLSFLIPFGIYGKKRVLFKDVFMSLSY